MPSLLWRRSAGAALFCFLAGAESNLLATTAAAETRPNILFMFTDDQPQNCVGFAGNQHIKTPHLDELARRGTWFENAFVTTAICCSNRACILTGQQMYRHGIKDFKEPLSKEAFAQTYPALLRRAGYRTGYLGKFAVGNPSIDRQLALPADQFDYWYGFPQSINFLQKIDGQPRYLTEVMTEKAIEFLRSGSQDQPFCLTIAFKEPHGPFNYFDPSVPNDYEDVNLPGSTTFSRDQFAAQPKFIRDSLGGDSAKRWLENDEQYQQSLRTSYRTVTRADAAVGAILAELARLGLDKNTIVIFSSDHGSLLGDHGLSGKWLMYENSIRVPLIIYDPRITTTVSRKRIDEMALSIDLAPTMLSAANVSMPPAMQGESLMPLLSGKADNWRTEFYFQHTYNTNPPRSPIPVTEGVRTERWKYIRYPDIEPVFEQLFDLELDPLEQNNLATEDQHNDILLELRRQTDVLAER